MDEPRKLRLVMCWHMHQPDYRSAADGRFELPWTYLHALKDYTDMAWHLEQHPAMSCVVNFVPSLLDQLEDYGQQFRSGTIRDPLLAQLARPDLDAVSEAERQHILDACFKCNYSKMIEPFPAYLRLYQLHVKFRDEPAELEAYLSGQYLSDLLVWYHLAWIGESVRRSEPLVQRLMEQGILFSHSDRQSLFALIGSLISQIIPRYRQLQQRGQIEISTTPYHHPILPLLLDFSVARDAVPDSPLPVAPGYPGGKARAEAQIRAALEKHRQYFGLPAHGMWPAEGGVSPGAVDLLIQAGCRWTATGEQVLTNSLTRGDPVLPDRLVYLYQPYRYLASGGEIACFFRDDGLSDRIGFEYAKWHSRDAARDFVQALERIHESSPQLHPVVTIILDGENAWEYYPYNGYYFLNALYQELQDHPFIAAATFSECLSACSVPPANLTRLENLVSGSWVYGTFSTWMGNGDKNVAWDLLVEAKQCYDRVMTNGRFSQERATLITRQLGICEGSDWFWWFGDYNAAESVQSFDRLYRLNLANLYHLMEMPVPENLLQPLSTGSGAADAGGAMKRAS